MAATTVFLRCALLSVLLLCGAGRVLASPEAGEDDPMLSVLRERGLVAPGPGPAPGTPIVAPAPPGKDAAPDTAAEVVMLAMNFLGVRYRRGGSDVEVGFDCSGFTRHIFEQGLGLRLPRRSHEQAQQAGLREVPRTDLRPGDLVFFNTLRRAFSHVGIYIGDDRFVHAPRSGAQVRIEDMSGRYWARRFDGARRAAAAAPAPADEPRAGLTANP